MKNAVLVGFKRSPFTIANKGLLAGVRPEDILSQVINDLVKTTNINKDDIEDINNGSALDSFINKYDLDYVVVSYESMILYKEEYLNEILKVLELNTLDSIDIHNGNQKYYD